MHPTSSVEIKAIGGKGGNGCVSFFRARNIRKGGPNGGNGGKGGSVYARLHTYLENLSRIKNNQLFVAQKGEHGKGTLQAGHAGEDVIIEVPLNTYILNLTTNKLVIVDHKRPEVLLAAGGKKGLGNTVFKSSRNQKPYHFTYGELGEEKYYQLWHIKNMDVKILGEPNAGKSSLLKAMTAADPKIANYPYTTTTLQHGMVILNARDRFSLVDTPGQAMKADFKDAFVSCEAKLILYVIDLHLEMDVILLQLKYCHQTKYQNLWIVFNKIDLVSHFQDKCMTICKTLGFLHLVQDVAEVNREAVCVFMLSAQERLHIDLLSQSILLYMENEL